VRISNRNGADSAEPAGLFLREQLDKMWIGDSTKEGL